MVGWGLGGLGSTFLFSRDIPDPLGLTKSNLNICLFGPKQIATEI